MRFITLFAVLASIAGTTAVPHKRECGRKGSPAPSAGPSLGAVVALGEQQGSRNSTGGRHHHGGGGGRWRSESQSRAGPTLTTTSIVTIATSITDNNANIGQGGANGDQDDTEVEQEPEKSSSTKVVIPTSTSQQASAPTDDTVVAIGTGGSTGDTGSSSGSTSNGAGLAINDQSIKSLSGFLKGNLGWYTGWATTSLKGTDGLEWVPQVHGLGSVAGIKDASKSWLGVRSVLSFNEPDMDSSVGGTAIDARTAATQHQAWVKNLGGSYRIGAPGVARGSKKWLSDWVSACNGQCKYDFVPFHYYGTDPNDLISYAKDFHSTFGKPLWVTEWSCKDYGTGYTCNEAEVKNFMKTAIDWFRGDGKGIVERWAYFGAFADMASGGNPNGLENPDGSINAMGQYYISL